jgi:hypothetical protein
MVRGPDRHVIIGVADELGRVGTSSAPSRITVHRVLACQGLMVPLSRRRKRESYRRWEREEPT